MVHNFSSKKGVSMIELLGYIILYGVVMSSLATFVFVLMNTARKVNRQSILNRGIKMLYTEFLAQSIRFNADSVTINEATSDTVSITLEKRFRYNDEGERIEIAADDEVYANQPVKMTYSYKKNEDKMKVTYTYLDNSTDSSIIDLEFGMYITSTSSNDTDISKLFSVIDKSSYSKSLVFNGNLNYDKKKIEFNYVIPIYVVNSD